MKSNEKVNEKVDAKVKAYFDAWKKGDVKGMFDNAQLTFKSVHITEKEKSIEYLIGLKKLKSFKVISKTINKTKTLCDVNIHIVYDLGKKTNIEKSIIARLLCEKEAYQPYSNGTWGVNPWSIIKESKIPKRQGKGKK